MRPALLQGKPALSENNVQPTAGRGRDESRCFYRNERAVITYVKVDLNIKGSLPQGREIENSLFKKNVTSAPPH